MGRLCKVTDCPRASYSWGWCRRHYDRWRLHGDPLAGNASPGTSVAERLRRYSAVDGDCLLWTGAVSPGGYGAITINGRVMGAHRAAYFEWVGPLDGSVVVRHTCDRRLCILPEHLSAGTQAENIGDMVSRGRAAWQTGNGHGVTEQEKAAMQALRAQGMSPPDIAAAVGRSYSSVWRHLGKQ